MHHLLLAYLTTKMADQIGNTIGMMIDCVVHDIGANRGRILQLCVELNLYKSIPQGRIINEKCERL